MALAGCDGGRALNPLTRWRAHWPFVCEHVSTPPAVLLSAKLLVIDALVNRARGGFAAPFLPFIEWLDAPVVAAAWRWGLGALFWAGAFCVLFNLMPRRGMALAGAALILDIIACRLRFTNSAFLVGLLLVVFALTERDGRTRWWLRGQLALVYGGAAINKLLNADWRNGRYFAHWTGEILGLGWFTRLDAALSGGASWAMGWFVIVMEAVLAVLVLRPGATQGFVALGLCFHAGMLGFTGGVISWVFLLLMAAAFLALADETPQAPARMRPWWPCAGFAAWWGMVLLRHSILG
jgi:hypothetical protein